MSKPRYYWYGIVKKFIMKSKRFNNDMSFQEWQLDKAIYEAKKETEKLPNADLRLKAINSLLIDQTETYDSFAMKNYCSRRNVENWVTSFVNLVGKKAGF